MTLNAGQVKDAIIQWIRNYFDENGKDAAAVIGISGGKDSSVVAALCVRALGADRVYGVLLPKGEQHDLAVARDVVRYLGIKHCTININDSVRVMLTSIQTAGLQLNRQAEINTPARTRMAILYAVSAIIGGRVANTCNLSEDWVGYSTKFGDSAGDFSPLSRLTVAEVKAVGAELGLPSRFIEKIPEDGLSGLSDEENLGFSYTVLDRYIREGICDDNSIRTKIDRLRRANLHKLNLMPCYEPDPRIC